MRIAVFGSANMKPDRFFYKDAQNLGMMAGMSGHDVINGGYAGIMEAVSLGALPYKRSIGYLCSDLEDFFGCKPNDYLSKNVQHVSLNARTLAMIRDADVYVCYPGAIGTLTEYSLAMQATIMGKRKYPVFLVGGIWIKTLEAFMHEVAQFATPTTMSNMQKSQAFVNCAEDIFAILEKEFYE